MTREEFSKIPRPVLALYHVLSRCESRRATYEGLMHATGYTIEGVRAMAVKGERSGVLRREQVGRGRGAVSTISLTEKAWELDEFIWGERNGVEERSAG